MDDTDAFYHLFSEADYATKSSTNAAIPKKEQFYSLFKDNRKLSKNAMTS
ncbi:hypothetical protein Hanom_Chr16g01423891 [Helianthus anomalus]